MVFDNARRPAPHPPGADIAHGLLGEGLTARLEQWAAEARVADAARRRSQERWLRQQAEEEGTLAGVLVDLAERGAPVALHTRAGRQHRGVVRCVGTDFVALEDRTGAVLVVLGVVSSIRTRPGESPTTGDRQARRGLRLAEVLVGLAAERERALLISLDGTDVVAGTVRSVGHDLVVVRAEGEPHANAYVPLAGIGEVVLER